MTISPCRLCPNECGADRNTSPGRCHAAADARICRAALHPWEEPIISGTRGSGTIFFSGCSLGCVFCQNAAISRTSAGRTCTTDELIDTMKRLVDAGAHNINFVNPTHYAHILFDVLSLYRPPVPVVYNTGGYDKVETLRALDGLIDIYLPDLKYLSPTLALRYSGHGDYPAVACAAIDEMVRQTGAPRLAPDGLLSRGVIVRHLVLPGQSAEAVRVADYLATRYGDRIYISAMSQYTPHGDLSDFPELARRVRPIEYKRMVEALRRHGITQCFVQESDSADAAYIPDFEL